MKDIKINRQRYRKYNTNKERIIAVFFLFIVFLLFASKNVDLRSIINNNTTNENQNNSKEDRFERNTITNDNIIITELQLEDSIILFEEEEINFSDSLDILEEEIFEISPR